MKKRETKLQLHRETLKNLENDKLGRVQGGLAQNVGIDVTGCDPNCGKEY